MLLHAQTSKTISSKEWKEDIHFVVETIEKEHPDPYWRVSKDEFQVRLNQLLSELDQLNDLEIQVRLIQLVAYLQDGHTDILPYGPIGFKSIFPIRFYQFTDGIFITAISIKYKEIAGSQVLKVGDISINNVIESTATLWNNENEFRKLEGAVFYLSCPEALKALNIIENLNTLPLTIRLKSGEIKEVEISREEEDFDLSFTYWGEMWGPGSVEYVTGFDNLSPDDYYNQGNAALPLHLKYRSTFWFTYLEESKTLYLQLNGMGDSRKESFSSFLERLWAEVDNKEIKKFILDIRYNVGGDGSRVNELVHGFIKRDQINSPEKLFTVLGRATFSAGVNLATSMKEHTRTNLIGSPAGAYFNHNGDAIGFTLPNSQMELNVSTVWHQPRSSRDRSQLICIDIPIEFSSDDYFDKKDPIIDFIIETKYQPLKELILTKGAVEGIEEYEKRAIQFNQISWWCSIGESDWNKMGYELKSLGKNKDALYVFQHNTNLFPNSWKACDSLAELYAELGKKKESIFWYQKALEINPLNFNAQFQKEMIEKQSN